MKNYEDMARNVLHRIDEYEIKRKSKQIRLKRTAAFAAPVCAAAILGFGLWKSGVSLSKQGQIVGQLNDTSVSSAVSEGSDTRSTDRINAAVTTRPSDSKGTHMTSTEALTSNDNSAAGTETTETQTAPSEQNLSLSNPASGDRDGDAVINGEYYLQTFPDVTYTADRYIGSGSDFDGFYKNCGTSAEFYTVKESADIVLVKLGNGGQVYLKKTNVAPPETPSLITSYPLTAAASYAAPPNGECSLSHGLYCAMEDYSGSADYLLKGDIFSDNHQIFDRDVLQTEAERLSSLGYNVTVVSESMQSGEDYYYLTLTLTYEQIRNFPKADNYGYFLRLYDDD